MLAIMLLFIASISAFNTSSITNIISTERDIYKQNEVVVISLNFTNLSSPMIKLISDTKVYNYLNPANKFKFIPPHSGIYILQLLNSSQLLYEKKFFVYANNSEQINLPEDESVQILINKDIYEAEDTVDIYLNVTSTDKLSLSILSRLNTYNFIGDIEKNIRFIPKTEGMYEIQLYKENEIIASKLFNVLGESVVQTVDYNNTPMQNDTIIINQSEVDHLIDIFIQENLTVFTEVNQTLIGSEEQIEDNLNETLAIDPIDIKLKVRNSKGYFSFIDVKLIDKSQKKTSKLTTLSSNSIIMGVYDIELFPEMSGIQKITLAGVDLRKNFDLGLEQIPKDKIKLKEVKNAFAIDPRNVAFNQGVITITAKGKQLLKCKEWNFTKQSCLGDWTIIKSIVPGENYTLILDRNDPAFVEVGLATVNTDKPIYHPGETAKISIVVLNNEGRLVTNAEVDLVVTDPLNNSAFYSTASGSIYEAQRGIYKTQYTIGDLQGNYTLFISVIGQNVNNSMLSYFSVLEFYEFDILRESPLAINPWEESFQSSIRILSYNYTNHFSFTEKLPINFTVYSAPGAYITQDNKYLYLTWTNLTNNSEISYRFNVPLITPELYELGPSSVAFNNNVFYEARPWFLAVDPDEFNVSIFVYDTQGNTIYNDDTLEISASMTSLVPNGSLYDFGNIGSIIQNMTYVVEIRLKPDFDFAFDNDYRRETFIKSDHLFSLTDTSDKEYIINTSLVVNDGSRSEDIFVSQTSNVDYSLDSNVGESGRVSGSIDIFTGDANQDAYWHNTSGNGATWTNNLITATLGQTPKDMDYGDINGDGRLDLIYSLKKDPPNEIGWLQNSGATWTSTTIYNVNKQDGSAVAVGDIDNDGDLDVVSGHGDNSLYWHDNTNGDGTSWTNNQISADIGGKPGKFHSIVLVDIDNDGDLDIVVGHEGNSVLVYKNTNGDGSSWSAPITVYTSANKISGIAAADIDNDGDVDIISTDANQDIYWHENFAGGGSWANRIVDTGVGNTVNGVDAADLDNDGDVDIVVGIKTNVIREYESGGGSRPTWTSNDIVANTQAEPFFVKIADLDSDNDPDIVYSRKRLAAGAQFIFVRNDGGSWTEVSIFNPGNLDGATLALGDVDYTGPSNIIDFFTNYSENAEQGVDEFSGWDNLTAGNTYSFYFVITPDKDWNAASSENDTLVFYLNNESYSSLYMTHKRQFNAIRTPLKIKWSWNITFLQVAPPDSAPTVTLSSPPDNATDANGDVTFTCQVTDDVYSGI